MVEISREKPVEDNAEHLWNQLLLSDPGPTEDDLAYIIANVSALQEKAAEHLFSQEPKNKYLFVIMVHSETLRLKAWDVFVYREPSTNEVAKVLRNIPSLRNRAIEVLLARKVPNRTLTDIVLHVPEQQEEIGNSIIENNPDHIDLQLLIKKATDEKLKERAGRKLLIMKPRHSALFLIIKQVESLRLNAAKLLMEKIKAQNEQVMLRKEHFLALESPDIENLKFDFGVTTISLFVIMKYVPELRDEAWARFSNAHQVLCYVQVLKHIEPLQEKAWNKLLELDVRISTLLEIIADVPNYAQKAAKLILNSQGLRDEEITKIILTVPSMRKKAWDKLVSRSRYHRRTVEFNKIMEEVEELREEAARLILQGNPSQKLLRRIIESIPEVRNDAIGLYLSHPKPKDLEMIREWMPSLIEEISGDTRQDTLVIMAGIKSTLTEQKK